jgi:hypothetical protein
MEHCAAQRAVLSGRTAKLNTSQVHLRYFPGAQSLNWLSKSRAILAIVSRNPAQKHPMLAARRLDPRPLLRGAPCRAASAALFAVNDSPGPRPAWHRIQSFGSESFVMHCFRRPVRTRVHQS